MLPVKQKLHWQLTEQSNKIEKTGKQHQSSASGDSRHLIDRTHQVIFPNLH